MQRPTSKMIGRVDEHEHGIQQKAELVDQTLGEQGNGEDVDASLARRRLVLVDQQRPGQQEDADRRADARCQPLAHLAPHFCKHKIIGATYSCLLLYYYTWWFLA